MTKDKDQSKASEQADAVTVVFAQDYRGVLTAEQFYSKGERVTFPAAQARALVDAGRAKFAVDVK